MMPYRRHNPYPGLLVAAMIPALVIGAVWKVADHFAPEVHVPLASKGIVTPPTAMSTPLLSVRRAPGVLADDAGSTRLQGSLGPLLNLIDDSSCVDISVNGQHVAGKNQNLSLRPASNMKLVTALVALEVLGPDYTYTTTVQGDLDSEGVVQGNLFLVGGGDPVLGDTWWNGPNFFYPPFNMTIIEQLADTVIGAGVKAVTGAVVGDASRYDDEWYAPSWTQDVRFVEAGPIAGLLVNDSRESLTIAANDPSVGAANVFTKLLQERFVMIGKVGKSGRSTSATTIASIRSNPLSSIINEMLVTSDNNTAEMLLKEIGLAKGGSGTSIAGLAVVNATLQSWGVPMDGVTIADGSGLSDDNRLTCAALLTVLQHASGTGILREQLPLGGQPGSTLYDGFQKGKPLSGVIRAKTGTLYNYQDGVGGKPGAKALSGYVPLRDGGEVEFSLLLNGPQIAEQVNYRPIWDVFATTMATYVASPTAIDLGPR